MLLAATEPGFSVPSLSALFDFPAFAFADSEFFALNRTGGLYLIAALITSLFVIAAFSNAKAVPGKLQNFAEMIVDIVRERIIAPVMGEKGMRFLPVLFSLFLFIWVVNLLGVMPLVNFSPNGRMAMPALLAIFVWMLFVGYGFVAQGPLYPIKAITPDVPKLLLILVMPIEFISVFILRPITLAFRLFANLMAGHIFLTITLVTANAFLYDFHGLYNGELFGFAYYENASWGMVLVGLVGLAGGVAVVMFELLVGLLQAYIFTILAAVYIEEAVNPAH